jgi:hypothetical protein
MGRGTNTIQANGSALLFGPRQTAKTRQVFSDEHYSDMAAAVTDGHWQRVLDGLSHFGIDHPDRVSVIDQWARLLHERLSYVEADRLRDHHHIATVLNRQPGVIQRYSITDTEVNSEVAKQWIEHIVYQAIAEQAKRDPAERAAAIDLLARFSFSEYIHNAFGPRAAVLRHKELHTELSRAIVEQAMTQSISRKKASPLVRAQQLFGALDETRTTSERMVSQKIYHYQYPNKLHLLRDDDHRTTYCGLDISATETADGQGQRFEPAERGMWPVHACQQCEPHAGKVVDTQEPWSWSPLTSDEYGRIIDRLVPKMECWLGQQSAVEDRIWSPQHQWLINSLKRQVEGVLIDRLHALAKTDRAEFDRRVGVLNRGQRIDSDLLARNRGELGKALKALAKTKRW